MRAALLIAIVLIFAGTANAQLSGGSLNTSSAINSVNGVNDTVGTNTAGSMNSQPGTSSTSGGHANRDASVNQNSGNPGQFVPSTFSSYKDALAIAKLEAALQPISVAEAARLAQEQRKKETHQTIVQLDEDAQGKLVIASASAAKR